MATTEQCGLCGADPAHGYALIGDTRFCHGDDDPEPTCYMRAQSCFCNLCDPPRRIETDALFEHFRIVHGRDVKPMTWPDGEYVVVDTTLEPGDFG